MVLHRNQHVLHVEANIMNKKRKNIIKFLLILSWVSIGILAVILFGSKKVKLLKDERLDPIYILSDRSKYNISIKSTIIDLYSPLYSCREDSIPPYLDNLASSIDSNLEKVIENSFIIWRNSNNEDIIVYNMENTVLNLYLTNYNNIVEFNTVEDFVSKYLDEKIKYFDIKIQEVDTQKIYTANRKIDDNELLSGYGYSDFFVVENEYLTSARILLLNVTKEDGFVPLIKDVDILEKYVNSKEFPKSIIINTSEIIQTTPQTYEDFDLDFKYDSCIINEIEPKLYFSSCKNNYIYYVYSVSGVCDMRYDKNLSSVSFQGFINAIDPEYVKSIE